MTGAPPTAPAAQPPGGSEPARADRAIVEPARAPNVTPWDVLKLAWPAVLSYLLNNAYRINDQFWIQGLGGEAQAAVAGILFVAIMNFTLVFLPAVGTLALVARATGAGQRERRDAVISSALVAAVGIWILLAILGPLVTPSIVRFLGLEGATADFALKYLTTLYLCCLPLVLAPTLDHAMIGMGNTLLPSLMELAAVVLNYFLAPILIYGPEAAQRIGHPGAGIASAIASFLGLHGHGIVGAAVATALSRAVSVSFGLYCLHRFYGVRYSAGLRTARRLGGRLLHVLEILRISAPISISIATYSAVYWALIKWVMVPIGSDALAGLGIGFSCFEGVSFPFYLGISMAGASLVGRSLGAGNPERALSAVRSSRILCGALGIVTTGVFLFIGPVLAPYFSADPGVVEQISSYVSTLAFSQFFVSQEAANEKILIGAGYTRPALWVSLTGNGLRVPLAWLLALHFSMGASGVWWAINLTSMLKASLHFTLVQRKRWLRAHGTSPLP
jgi:MATE family, multidrug efflux pump